MATMYPEELFDSYRRNPKRSAEIPVYEALDGQLGAEWHVFYDVPWLAGPGQLAGEDIPEADMAGIPEGSALATGIDNPRAEDGQADFAIAHARKGILLVEVKGGGIAYDGKTCRWSSQDRNGNIHDINPVELFKRC